VDVTPLSLIRPKHGSRTSVPSGHPIITDTTQILYVLRERHGLGNDAHVNKHLENERSDKGNWKR